MLTEIEALAPAKINIGLAVGERDAEGYHAIASVFQAVSVRDRIRIGLCPGEGLSVVGAFDCPPEATTIHKAAEFLMRSIGARRGLRIEVEKGIPVKAGMGGGSSDAAAVLVGLNRLLAAGLNAAELAELGARVGADVPFFLGAGAAYVRGRGEKVEALEPRTGIGLVLVEPGFGVGTAEAYSGLDALRAGAPGGGAAWPAPPLSSRGEAALALASDPASWGFTNDFAAYLYARHPVYRDIELSLRGSGAVFVSVTGSGSAVFGVFGSEAEAEAAVGRAAAMGGKALSGMRLRTMKPLETCIVLR